MTSASHDHERRLVAVLFMDDGVSLQKAIAAGLTPAHFADPVFRLLFEVACDLLRQRRPVAEYQAATWLQDHGKLDAVGGMPKLAELLSWNSTSAPFVSDLQRTLTAHALRKVAHHADAAHTLATSPAAGDLSERFDEIMPHLRAAQEAGNPSNVRDLKAIAEAAAHELESDKPRGIPGPFPAWDRVAGAVCGGELLVLAARPAVGKTAMALQHLTACAGSGRPCVMFSLEMTGEELCGRLARQAVGAHATNRELASWIRAKLPSNSLLTIYDGAAGATLAQIESRCRLHAAHPRGLGLVVIDYLQLIAPAADLRRETRERQVATITRALKLLANELRVPVLLLAQLNRESEKEDRRPRLTDLRESGAIEQDADAVWFLHPDTSGPQFSDAERAPVLLIQAKRRSGPHGVALKLTFNRPAVTFGP